MFRVRCEWGPNGVMRLAAECDVVVIVDVLSFTTTVDIAVSRSIQVLPYGGSPEDAHRFAEEHNALLASHRGAGAVSLSPASFTKLTGIDRVVLPSPNGSTLTLLTAGRSEVFCGCLRNASAVAEASSAYQTVGVIPAGEKWPDGSLRPALEDWLGAGAIIANLPKPWSPEAEAAVTAFQKVQQKLAETLIAVPSGIELVDKGFPEDVELASMYDVSHTAPRFNSPAYC